MNQRMQYSVDEANKNLTNIVKLIDDIQKKVEESQSSTQELLRKLDDATRQKACIEANIADLNRQKEVVEAQQQKFEADKLAEFPSANRSCVAAMSITDPFWYEAQLLIREAKSKSSYGEPETKFDVRLDEDTRLHNLEVKHKYAVKCRTVLGNEVVVVIEGKIIW